MAVVGATDRGDAYGAETLRNLAAFGFAGEVWGVNPGRTEALGVPCFPSLADLPGGPGRGVRRDPRRRACRR